MGQFWMEITALSGSDFDGIQQYCAIGEDVGVTKTRLEEAAGVIRERIGPWTKLKILVAHDIEGFNDFSADFGWYGPRIRKYH